MDPRASASTTTSPSTASASSLLLLTAFVSLTAAIASWNIEKSPRGYHAMFLLLLTGMLGVFVAMDLFLFYVFWEIMLLPMYFLIGIWGGPRRQYAAIKFFLYTLFGSVLLLAAVILVVLKTGTVVDPRDHGRSAARRSLRRSGRRHPRRGGLCARRLHRDVHRLRDQGPVLPVPHVVAGRARRGADADLHDPGRRAAEDGRLRSDPHRLPVLPDGGRVESGGSSRISP